MIDYHVHTDFSGDCQEPMENTIKKAIEKGGREICFTDHLDYDYPTDESFDFDDINFTKTLEAMQKKYGEQINILKGIELGLQPQVIGRCKEFLKDFNADFVLCSFHVTDYKDMYNGDYYQDRTSEDAWLDYFKEVKSVLENFKAYSVVGHLDIPKRYDVKTKAVAFSIYKDAVKEVLELIIKDGKGIEVNTSGLRSDLKETLPNREILELYHQLGGKYITIGSDSHYHGDVYENHKAVIQMLKEIGFEYITTYKNMQAKQEKI